MNVTPNQHRRRWGAIIIASIVVGATVGCAPPTGGNLGRNVNPCVTQAAITCDPITGHLIAGPQGTPRHQLALVFNGAQAAPAGYQKMVDTLSAAGFHVAAIRYSSTIGTTAACPNTSAASDPDCHRNFRGELAFGAGVVDPLGTTHDNAVVNVSGTNSVVNRTLQLVEYLAGTFPSENWRQFQNQINGICDGVDPAYGACDLDWSKVVLVGHSLGAGEALFLSKFHDVARVAMISGPYDEYFDGPTITVAPWIAEGGFATSASDMFGFTHTQEPNAAGQSAAWDALGLSGPPVSVDSNSEPYAGAQQLTTTVTPACPLDSNGKHNSTSQDACTPGSPPLFAPVWRYLAGV